MDIMDPYETAKRLYAQSGFLAITHALLQLRSLDEDDDLVGVFAWELVLDALFEISHTTMNSNDTIKPDTD